MSRIVHITDSFDPHPGAIGAHVRDLAHYQGASGDVVHILTATPLPSGADDFGRNRFRVSTTDAPGVRLHRLASWVGFGLPVLPRGRATIERALGLLRPDVVHLHLGVVSPFGYDAARAARVADLPLVITWYSTGSEAMGRFGVRLTGWDTALFVASAVNEEVAKFAEELLSREDIAILPFGVDATRWQAAATRPEPAEGPVRILCWVEDTDHARDILRSVAASVSELSSAHHDDPLRLTLTGPATARLDAAEFGRVVSDVEAETWVSFLPDAPAAVLPTIIRAHDVYLSLAAHDRMAAGARIAGLALVVNRTTADLVGDPSGDSDGYDAGHTVSPPAATTHEGGMIVTSPHEVTAALVALVRRPTMLATMGTYNAHAPRDWAHVSATARELYARAIFAVGRG